MLDFITFCFSEHHENLPGTAREQSDPFHNGMSVDILY
jgi:hypothetical protein